jgi:hypothetical protein
MGTKPRKALVTQEIEFRPLSLTASKENLGGR